jgi:(E)-4-hydroxy-3-methylbut-2-enyl-diphosphate synthase
MTKVKPGNLSATVAQIRELEEAGCNIVRVAVPNLVAIDEIRKLKKRVRLPIEADIHFSPRLALEAIAAGADAVRLNPGNISDPLRICEICRAAGKRRIPIRVGVNSGSVVERSAGVPVRRAGTHAAGIMVSRALGFCKILEKLGFHAIIVSLKAADVLSTVEAYRLAAKRCDYPFHLGVTATGFGLAGVVKSAIGIGSLLLDGIGDTIRVSLTAPPVQEVEMARAILRAVGLQRGGIEVIACPTCGRAEIDVLSIAQEIERRLADVSRHARVAVMGCVVNGPGEAAECDIGIAGGRTESALFRKGQIVRKLKTREIISAFVDEVRRLS